MCLHEQFQIVGVFQNESQDFRSRILIVIADGHLRQIDNIAKRVRISFVNGFLLYKGLTVFFLLDKKPA